MSEIQETQEIQEIEEMEETEEMEEEIPKKKAGRPKGSKNVAKAKAKPKAIVKKPIEPPIIVKNEIAKESTRPPVKHVHRKSRTRVIVLSSSSDESDHKIRVVRKPAKRYEYSSDSDSPPKAAPAPAPAPAPKPLEPETPRPQSIPRIVSPATYRRTINSAPLLLSGPTTHSFHIYVKCATQPSSYPSTSPK